LALTEPHGERTRFVCLKQLRNPGRTHAGGTRALPDRQLGLLSRHHSPDPCALGVGQPRHGTAESGEHLWLTTDTLLHGFRGFHTRKDSRFSFRCTANCTPPPDFLRVCYSHPVQGSGYIQLWDQLHRAEEALSLFAPLATVIADAWFDEIRLNGRASAFKLPY
jgi:hypothetical protein